MQKVTHITEYYGVTAAAAPQLKFEDADYLAFMCHEIGTPLAAIIGLSHILSDIDCSVQKKAECAQMLRDSSNVLTGLMKNMLDSSKIGAGMLEIENINFDLHGLIREAAHIVAIKALEKGLDLHVNIADGLPAECIGDPLRISQILLNLLSNAIKFTEKGHITIYVSAQIHPDGHDQLRITVADTGAGICKESLDKIFNKYTQANSSISRKYGGTGLGLSISQNLANLMHGEITVRSWPGIGSRFVLTLPLCKAPLPVASV